MKGAFLFLADGFEETEALATVDVLRRGGIDLRTVSISDDEKKVTSSHKITVLADMTYSEFEKSCVTEGTAPEDVMVFPGGMPGSTNLAAHERLMSLMLKHYSEGGLVAAICAAPSVVLSKLPDIGGAAMTCYEGFEDALVAKGADVTGRSVECERNIITGRGAGVTIEFGLRILEKIKGRETAEQVKKSIMCV